MSKSKQRYSEEARAKALAALAANGGNLTRTARETGISRRALGVWASRVSEHPEHPEAPAEPADDTSWWPAFLTSLMETCNVSTSVKAAGVGRVTAYEHRKRHPEFAAAWDAAKDIGAETLEDEAVRRARDGWEEPVFYQGEEVATVRKYSDGLLQFLLRGARPDKYRERIDHTGKDGKPIEISVPDVAEALALLRQAYRAGD